MSVTAEKTVRELALESASATRIFENWVSTTAAEATSLWKKLAESPTSQ